MTIYFDIGATLIEGPDRSPARYLADKLKLDEQARRRIDHHILTTYMNSPDDLVHYLSEQYGLRKNLIWNTVLALWRSQVEEATVVSGGFPLIQSIYSMGIPYGFISNIWYPYSLTFFRRYGDLASLDNSFFSFRLGVAKPDIAIYKRALSASGGKAHSSVMVGDSYENDIAPAITLGMRTVWVMRRAEKEKQFYSDVVAGRLPAPSLIVSSLSEIYPSVLLQLMNRKEIRNNTREIA